ncbi:uncharacterized protein F5891DRAFT_1231741 [Suillus fuscotomentosus]|uniref:Uncharacterized protein n=1 Tax=Suillus fuscotomentosus TaxID=1912939 RepID=A0AAD4E570_9AGAM|nr:uncharacterized protein F5891DRAFT_1231741 [Suillus fuscotomentosus]KAG1899767.1 hypothetical protein F5891DRAFT_1231741 [Suillus fuscotomentosus]
MNTSSPPCSPPRSSSPSNSSGASSGGTLVESSTYDLAKYKGLSSSGIHVLSKQINSDKSPESMISVLSPTGSHRSLPFMDEVPSPPDGKESLFFRHSDTPPPGASPRAQYLRERMSRKHQPYPLHPAPLELRFAARVTGRVRQPEFTPEETEQNEQLVERGLSQLSLATLYKAYKAKLASRETARQRLLTTTWEIEEAERYTAFLEALHVESKRFLGLEDAKLEKMREWFSSRNLTEVADDTNYLQAVYDDECEILRSLSTQARQVSKILGKHSDDIFSASTGESTSKSPLNVLSVVEDEDDLDDFSDLEA